MEIVGKARKPALNPHPIISSTKGSGQVKEKIKNHPRFSKNLEKEEPEAAQSTCCKNENSDLSSQCLESTMEMVVESRNPARNRASGFSSTGGLGLAKEEQNNGQEENGEHKVEEEYEYNKQVKEVYEDKQVKEDDEHKQAKKVHEDKQVKEAYKFKSYRYKMIKLLYRTSLFLAYQFLQSPWYQ